MDSEITESSDSPFELEQEIIQYWCHPKDGSPAEYDTEERKEIIQILSEHYKDDDSSDGDKGYVVMVHALDTGT